ncbi:rhomboid family intramembrane serine protease [Chlorobium phaeobacteroides]|uniref:Rhomboid family protein n=1 Tax=Chlorobium phaeobacteroides (strain DSM 266 / SMG 266 / 2430) TaxID=290317 RepID=A1BJZ2_CHLPD|nr:rhomboid family intramembrane serine protease [Chlorobium phaeobacteroides]ABL66719.1 Rhomboid family protein [Chlorobium phaeobacteroides DSM 266]
MNNNSQPYSPGGFQVIPPAIKLIILANVAIFLFQTSGLGAFITAYGALWPINSHNDTGLSFQIWQPVTYMFLHGSMGHLFFNMFALWIFGTEIENYWGTRQFTIYYFICGIGAALINLLTTIGDPYSTVGASGAIYGILLAFGMMFPERYIYLYFLLPVKAKYFVAGYAFLEFISGLGSRTMGSGSNIAHFAHLGGMLVGFIYITLKRQEWSLSRFISKARPALPKKKSAAIHNISSGTTKPSEEEIDAILDKISRNGYESLTGQERQKLLKAGGKES